LITCIIRATTLRDGERNIIGAIESFSNNASVIDARRKLQELRHVAMSDPLTWIGNRRHLDGRLSAVIAEYQINASIAGLLFIDVDHFKEVNDTYGHNTGDDVLRMVANTIRYALRLTDTVGRWGGDEFLAILHDVQDKEALRFAAEKVRTLAENSRLDLNGQGLAVTVSIGGTLLQPGDTPELLVQRADELIYQSKQAGRKRVTIG